MAQKLAAVAVSCGRRGLVIPSVSVPLDQSYASARNKDQAAQRIEFIVEECAIAKDGFYKNSDPQADAVTVGRQEAYNSASTCIQPIYVCLL
jgi:hypothetical protein